MWRALFYSRFLGVYVEDEECKDKSDPVHPGSRLRFFADDFFCQALRGSAHHAEGVFPECHRSGRDGDPADEEQGKVSYQKRVLRRYRMPLYFRDQRTDL